jgi:type II secretory pathway component PulF
MNEAEVKTDTSIYRLISTIAAALTLLLALYALYLAVVRLPRYREIFADFDTKLPKLTVLLMDVPLLPAAFAVLSLILCLASIIVPQRMLLSIACISAFLSFCVVGLAEFALQVVMITQVQSLSA